jgi:hypothetical protein
MRWRGPRRVIAGGSRGAPSLHNSSRVLPIGNQTAGLCCYARSGVLTMNPRSLEELLRDDAYLPPRRSADVAAETVAFAAGELAEIDLWARRNKIKNRTEAIRQLVGS